jgi:hypothetical protein
MTSPRTPPGTGTATSEFIRAPWSGDLSGGSSCVREPPTPQPFKRCQSRSRSPCSRSPRAATSVMTTLPRRTARESLTGVVGLYADIRCWRGVFAVVASFGDIISLRRFARPPRMGAAPRSRTGRVVTEAVGDVGAIEVAEPRPFHRRSHLVGTVRGYPAPAAVLGCGVNDAPTGRRADHDGAAARIALRCAPIRSAGAAAHHPHPTRRGRHRPRARHPRGSARPAPACSTPTRPCGATPLSRRRRSGRARLRPDPTVGCPARFG